MPPRAPRACATCRSRAPAPRSSCRADRAAPPSARACFGASPSSSPRSRAARHVVRCEEYSPSRRSSAPIAPGVVQRSASRTIRRLYSAVNRRRCAFATTSVSGRLPPAASAAGAPAGKTPVALRAPSVSPAASSHHRFFSTTFIHLCLPALYSKLSLPDCLTLIGREGYGFAGDTLFDDGGPNERRSRCVDAGAGASTPSTRRSRRIYRAASEIVLQFVGVIKMTINIF